MVIDWNRNLENASESVNLTFPKLKLDVLDAIAKNRYIVRTSYYVTDSTEAGIVITVMFDKWNRTIHDNEISILIGFNDDGTLHDDLQHFTFVYDEHIASGLTQLKESNYAFMFDEGYAPKLQRALELYKDI